MQILAIIAAAAVSAVVGRFAFKWIFDDCWHDFWDCVKFSMTPDIISIFRREYFEDIAQSFKLGGFMIATFGSGFFLYWLIAGQGG